MALNERLNDGITSINQASPSDSPSKHPVTIKQKIQKLWNKIPIQPIKAIVSLGILFANYLSHCRVATVILTVSASSYCHEMSCINTDLQRFFWQCSMGLFIVASIGFITNLILQFIKTMTAYRIFKYGKEKYVEKQLRNQKNDLLLGWIPLFIQDFLSLVIMTFVAFGVQDITNLAEKYFRSVVWSLISLAKSTISTYQTHYKLKKKSKYGCARACHCCWSICLAVLILIGSSVLIILLADVEHAPYPMMSIYNNNTNSSVINLSPEYISNALIYVGIDATYTVPGDGCVEYVPTSDQDTNYGTEVYFGTVLEAPYLIYPDHPGLDYQYALYCTSENDKTLLDCNLKWTLTDLDYRYGDVCLFSIDLGVCSNYTIHCNINNFNFYEGNPKMFVCFDYCSFSLPWYLK